MSIFARLGKIINSYINDFDEETTRFNKTGFDKTGTGSDPDLDAAYDELNDFLNRKETRKNTVQDKHKFEELRADFECLGVPFGADIETCKTAYKKLLKIHHPDRHVGHEGNLKKATVKTAKINTAWDRIEKSRLYGNSI